MKQRTKLTPKQIAELNVLTRKNDSSGPEVRKALALILFSEGVSMAAIKAATTYSGRHVFTLRHDYEAQGLESLRDKRKGTPKELLTKKQREEIIEIVKTKSPRNYHYNNDFWTTSILGDLIFREYKTKYKSKTSYYLLKTSVTGDAKMLSSLLQQPSFSL
jgi:transposase